MKFKVLTTASLMLFFTLLGSCLCAQNSPQAPTVFQLNVPFEFVAGNRSFPAGTYSFERVLNTADGFDMLAIRCKDLKDRCTGPWVYHSMMTITFKATEPPSRSKVVFRRYGDRLFLFQVWTRGKLTGLQLRNREEINLVAERAADAEVELSTEN
jgi:hypothetical protein